MTFTRPDKAKLAIGLLLVLVLLVGGGNLYATYAVNRQSVQHQQAQQEAQNKLAEQQKAEQKRLSEQVGQKICASLKPLESLSSLKAPAGNPVTNPSRGFDQELVKRLAPLAQLGPDIGCK